MDGWNGGGKGSEASVTHDLRNLSKSSCLLGDSKKVTPKFKKEKNSIQNRKMPTAGRVFEGKGGHRGAINMTTKRGNFRKNARKKTQKKGPPRRVAQGKGKGREKGRRRRA